MSYSTYIGSVPKRTYNKIKSLSIEELCKFYNLDNPEYLDNKLFTTKLYDFGKANDFEFPKGSLKTFFKKKETNKIFHNDDIDFYLTDKVLLEYIINHYKSKIQTYYDKMILPLLSDNATVLKSHTVEYEDEINNKYDFSKITTEEQNAIYDIINHVRLIRSEWQIGTFDLNKGAEITSSWKYEYNIFELVRIYKTFDWKRNNLVYYGQ